MASYTTAYPSYSHHPHHHQASVYPHLYQSSTYSLPTSHPYETQPYDMPTYYVQPNSRSHRSSRSRARSNSHSAPGYSQPVYYTSGGSHSRDYAYGDSGRHRSASVGQGGYYYPSSHSSPGHRRGSQGYAPQYYTTSAPRRSYSTPRRTTQVIDARHSSSSYRPSTSYATNGTYSRSGSGYYHEPLGDRIRRWFGIGPNQHQHHHSSWKGTGYVDARTGQPVDSRGRKVYRM